MNAYTISKTLHIVFVTSWFAGLFYLPRLFVNMAMVEEKSSAEYQRLLTMSQKLLRFMTILAVPAIGFGLYLWLGVGIKGAWMHGKILVAVLILGYHHACWSLLKKFATYANTRSHKWYRWFNEVPVILLLIAVFLVVAKPF